jgi:hypothetical protein
MEDAYVIGIRLALEDGVSAGIATVRSELSELDRAVQASRLGLEARRRAAATATPRAAPPVMAEPESDKPDYRIEAESAHRNAPATPVFISPPESAPRVGTRGQSVSVDLNPNRRAPNGGEAPRVPARDARPDRYLPEVKPAALAAAPAGIPTVGRLASIARESSSVALAPAYQPSSLTVEPSGSEMLGAIPVQVLNGPAKGRDLTSTAAAGVVAPAAAPPAQSILPKTPAAAPAAAPQPAAPPSAAAGARGRMGGDVYLDGVRVGRWLEDLLDRNAGRPAAGPSFFDPRLSPSWPGASAGY